MSSKITELPLHEVVLKIMFHEDIEKAASMKAEDILWRIDNPEITQRKVTEVLNWLIHKKRVDLYLGKYTINRIEFLELKKIYGVPLLNIEKQNSKIKESFYITPLKKDKKNKLPIYFFLLIAFVFCYISYTFLDLKHQFKIDEDLNKESIITPKKIPKQRKLYFSKGNLFKRNDSSAIAQVKSINHSFERQNTINNLYIKSINDINYRSDSLYKAQRNEIHKLQLALNNSSKLSDLFVNKIILSNFIIIILFVILLYKKHFL